MSSRQTSDPRSLLPRPAAERFAIESCLGSGGFGIVYRAFDRERESAVALKWLWRTDAETVARFKREFRALADLSHPNLVTLRELITIDGEWFFTMDLVEGDDFLSYVRGAGDSELATSSTDAVAPPLERQTRSLAAGDDTPGSGPISPPRLAAAQPIAPSDIPRLLAAARQLVSGLSALHAAGKLHRDIKPSNVLVTREGRVVLLDFGLVLELGDDGQGASMTGRLVGTPGFMSPEQAGGLVLGPESDSYAVGVMLYAALTGRLPIEGTGDQILRRKLVEDPSPPHLAVGGVPLGLSELVMDLLSRDPERRPTGAALAARLEALDATSPGDRAPAHAPRRVPFVGRERELATLGRALDEAERGGTAVALVHGNSGMGKTALVRHFLETVRRERPRVIAVQGRCYERESVPFKALDLLIDSLCRHLSRLTAVELASVMPRDVAALAKIFPVLLQLDPVSRTPPTRASIDGVQLRRRAFEALRELVARLGDRHPVIIAIDDLQWGDLDSEPALRELLRGTDTPRMLLVVSYRREEGASAPLVRTLEQLRQGSAIGFYDVAVDELDDAAARALATALARPTREQGSAALAAQAIAREAAGSPLFIQQLSRAASADAHVDLSTLIARRVAELPADARTLLEIIAVSGRPLSLGVAVRAAGTTADPHAHVATLRAERLLRTRGLEERDHVEVYHDRIREVVVAGLDAERLASHHRKLAGVLAVSGQGDPEALTNHFLGAGDRPRAGLYALEAADRAAAALAFDRAARMYRLAIDLRSADDSKDPSLSERLGDALANAGRGHEAAEAYLEAAALLGRSEAMEVRRRAAEQLLISGRVDEGLSVMGVLLGELGMRLPRTPLRSVLSLLWNRLRLRLRGLSFRERTIASIPREALVRIDACYTLAHGLGLVDSVRGSDFGTRYLLLALAAGEPQRIVRALAIEFAYLAVEGVRSRAQVEKLVARAEQLLARLDSPQLRMFVTLMRGLTCVLWGDHVRGLPLFEEAIQLLRERPGGAWEIASAHYFSTNALIWLGRARELGERLPAMVDDARERGDLFGEVMLRAQNMYFLALANDDPDAAEREIDRAEALWSQSGVHVQHVWFVIGRAEVLLYRGRGRDAWHVVEQHSPALVSSLLPMMVQSLRVELGNLRARAAVAAARESSEVERERLLAIAERLAKRLAREGWPYSEPLAWAARAGVARLRGRTEDASAALRRAVDGFAAAGTGLYEEAARLRLGECIGGAEGERLVEDARRGMSDRGVKSPDSMARLLLPDVR